MKVIFCLTAFAISIVTGVADASQGYSNGPYRRNPPVHRPPTQRHPGHRPPVYRPPIHRPPVYRPPVIIHPAPVPPPYYPPTPTYEQDNFSARINRHFSGYNSVELLPLLGLGTYHHGRRVEEVIVRATSRYGYGQMQVFANSYPNSGAVTVDGYARDYRMYVTGNNELGWGISTLQLQIQGEITIESVTVRLTPRRR